MAAAGRGCFVIDVGERLGAKAAGLREAIEEVGADAGGAASHETVVLGPLHRRRVVGEHVRSVGGEKVLDELLVEHSDVHRDILDGRVHARGLGGVGGLVTDILGRGDLEDGKLDRVTGRGRA